MWLFVVKWHVVNGGTLVAASCVCDENGISIVNVIINFCIYGCRRYFLSRSAMLSAPPGRQCDVLVMHRDPCQALLIGGRLPTSS